MSEHHTQATLETTKYCNRCNRRTQHQVSNGRDGRCLEHTTPQFSKRQEAAQERRHQRDRQPNLFSQEARR